MVRDHIKYTITQFHKTLKEKFWRCVNQSKTSWNIPTEYQDIGFEEN